MGVKAWLSESTEVGAFGHTVVKIVTSRTSVLFLSAISTASNEQARCRP